MCGRCCAGGFAGNTRVLALELWQGALLLSFSCAAGSGRSRAGGPELDICCGCKTLSAALRYRDGVACSTAATGVLAADGQVAVVLVGRSQTSTWQGMVVAGQTAVWWCHSAVAGSSRKQQCSSAPRRCMVVTCCCFVAGSQADQWML